MFSWPQKWFVNIVGLLEKREYNVYSLVLLCLFTGIVRLLEEWAFGSQMWNVNPAAAALNFFSFYFFAFFAYGLALSVLVPQPWRRSINVIRVGIFLGIFPPLIDVFVYGIGVRIPYQYVRDFPSGWNWLIYNPNNGVPLGEAIVLWVTIALTAFYVWHKTNKISRFFAALVSGYVVVLVLGTLVATGAQQLVSAIGWKPSHLLTLITLATFFFTLIFYLILQPGFAAGLGRRFLHALPFVLACLAGFALTGPLTATAAFYALLVALIFAVALAQNDFYDFGEDKMQGRVLYLDREDLTFMNVIGIACLLMLAFGHSMASLTLGLILGLSFLYSYPFYRAKRYFPSNLKIEGMWGGLSFATGLIAGREQLFYGMPRWDHLNKLTAPSASPKIGLSLTELIALALVFGGFSLIGSLKDSKDIAADTAAGNQTLYTLWARKKRPVTSIHLLLSSLAAVAMASAIPLLWFAGKVSAGWIIGGAFIALLAWVALIKIELSRAFYYFLVLMNFLLITVVVSLTIGA